MGATHSHVCRAHSLFRYQAFSPIARQRVDYSPRRTFLLQFVPWCCGNSAANLIKLRTIGKMTRSSDQGRQVQVHTKARKHSYEISIGRGILDSLGEETRKCLTPHSRRIAVLTNERVFELYGKRALGSLRATGLLLSPWLMGEGERFKSLRSAQ